MTKKEQNLNDIQRRAATHNGGPLLIAAGAGSGKTRTLTSRLIHLLKSGVKPENVIAITFTNKAAREMESRIKNHELWIKNFSKPIIHNSKFLIPFIGTFHSLGVQILKSEAKLVGRTPHFTIFDEDDSLSLVKKILADLNLSKDRFNPLAILAQISQIKNELSEEDESPPGSHYEKITLSVFKKYEDTLQKSNAFDFDDLIEKVVRIFQSHPEVLETYQTRWQHIGFPKFSEF